MDSTHDVIVVGAGNAALTAALSAHQHGARVLVLEKAPRSERGGNSRFSGGLFRFAYESIDDILPLMPHLTPEDRDRFEVGNYPPSRFYGDIMRVTRDQASPELSTVLTEQSYPTMRWMSGLGITWDWTSLWSLDKGTQRRFNLGSVLEAKNKGVGLVAGLFTAVDREGIEICYETKVEGFQIGDDGQVTGLHLATPTGTREIAAKAVVLGSGGFEADETSRTRHLGDQWKRVKVRGTRHNTGEVLREALKAGAKAAGQWEGCHATPIDAAAPDVGDLRLTDKTNRLSYPYGILINRQGVRFFDEGEDLGPYTYAKAGSLILGQPGSVAYQVFDQKTLHLLEARYSTGNPVEAEDIAGLASALGLDPDKVARTVDEFNSRVLPGEFDPTHKDGKAALDIEPPKSNWALPIDSAPYVAYPVTCGITFTFGGLKIDTEARVIDTRDSPMPGLFATGEITGEFFYHNYPGGSGLMRGAVFGRIAGRNAAAYGHG